MSEKNWIRKILINPNFRLTDKTNLKIVLLFCFAVSNAFSRFLLLEPKITTLRGTSRTRYVSRVNRDNNFANSQLRKSKISGYIIKNTSWIFHVSKFLLRQNFLLVPETSRLLTCHVKLRVFFFHSTRTAKIRPTSLPSR